MLYVSTKNKAETFTAYRVLHKEEIPRGGLFAPFHLPVFQPDEIAALKDLSFHNTVAKILNLFFSCRLTGWDVEFSVGRYPFRLENIGQRVTVAELWHNNQSDYAHFVSAIYRKLTDEVSGSAPQWVCIAVEIAVLFGLYGELLRDGIDGIDIATTDRVLTYPIAAWYARKMGLPIGSILCGCEEASSIWDFFRRGEASGSVSDQIQRLIFENLGTEEACRFVRDRENGGMYRVKAEDIQLVSCGIYPYVIGADRVPSVVFSIGRSCGYHADEVTAAAYGALQDYRAAYGENRQTLLLSRCKAEE